MRARISVLETCRTLLERQVDSLDLEVNDLKSDLSVYQEMQANLNHNLGGCKDLADLIEALQTERL